MCAVKRSFLSGGALSGGSVNPVVETSVKRMCAAEELSIDLTCLTETVNIEGAVTNVS